MKTKDEKAFKAEIERLEAINKNHESYRKNALDHLKAQSVVAYNAQEKAKEREAVIKRLKNDKDGLVALLLRLEALLLIEENSYRGED